MGKEQISIAAKFPFVMLLCAILLRGSIFVAFNVPLMDDCADGNWYPDLVRLVQGAVVSDWQAASESRGDLASVSAFLFLSLVAGLCLAPIERGIALVPAVIWNRLFNEPKLFSGAEIGGDSYSDLLSWLLANPDKKAHWEWELFLGKVSWGLFLNLVIFVSAAVFLLWPVGWVPLGSCASVVVFYFSWAMAHSKVLKDAHSLYEGQRQQDRLRATECEDNERPSQRPAPGATLTTGPRVG